MKDSAVRPTVLFDPKRQKRLLEGLAGRFRDCLDQQRQLYSEHARQRALEETELSFTRGQKTDACRQQRRSMLQQWDEAEERLTSQYETMAITSRKHLTRLSALYRQKQQEETAAIHRKVEARKQAVLEQYETHKNQPGLLNRKELKKIDESLQSIHECLETARNFAVRRLDGLPPVPPDQEFDNEHRPDPSDSVSQTVHSISTLTNKCRSVLDDMQSGTAYKLGDSIWLPVGVVGMIIIWCVSAFVSFQPSPWIAMMIGSVAVGVFGFIVNMIMLLPLKKTTQRLYPQVERFATLAEECAAAGRKLSTQQAEIAAAELVQQRDSQLQKAISWEAEQHAAMKVRLQEEEAEKRSLLEKAIADADGQYTEQYNAVGAQMHARADALAQEITKSLADIDRELQSKRDANELARREHVQRLTARLIAGASRGMKRILASDVQVQSRFPSWDQVVASPQSSAETVDFLPLGWLQVNESLRSVFEVKEASQQNGKSNPYLQEELSELLADSQVPEVLPVVLHRRLHSGVILNAPPDRMNQAIELAHVMLWRLLTGAAAARAKLTLIDPVGRGQHFTSFMALADHDPTLVGHRVWTTDGKIDARLAELAHHVEDVLQSSLRDRFQRIEDYNQIAGSMAEPYRAIAAVGLPEGMTRDGYKHLRALIESGVRCGIFTILVCDQTKPWPSDMPKPKSERILQLSLDDSGQWRFDSDGLEGLPFVAATPPPKQMRNDLVEQIGTSAVAASRVEIPLDDILHPAAKGAESTNSGIQIPIGSQGGNRSLSLELGEGVRQHVLIAGKTGSGKSTLLHSIITSGAYQYSSDQLQFYLLDFKKGVEFKPYAESGFPHARVIGIESEREFGRSVLQRLDAELQQRGEMFRANNVQELSDYRAASGKALPRIMLVIDEFQELFVRDDRLAGDCAMLLDRLVRQGRSFGMHVVLSSQSLAGAYSLPRATLGQMAVRIAMHCSESDAALILSDDNTAARLLSRPGEAIYNDAGGLIEGNQPFQVAWLSSKRHQELLGEIADREDSYASTLGPPVVFEGNRPCRWSPALASAAIESETSHALKGLLGESVEIGPPQAIELTRNSGRNVLLITPPESRSAVLASTLSGLAKSDNSLKVVYFDGSRADDPPSLAPWLEASGIPTQLVRPRESDQEMIRLADVVKERGDDAEQVDPIVVVIDPAERFRDLRQDESFNFSLDSAGAASGANALQDLLRDGPSANVFVIFVCGSAETFSRWLPRASQHDLELRVLGRMNASDSSTLIDTPAASDLSTATMLLYDDSDGRVTKFRQCDLPPADKVAQWL